MKILFVIDSFYTTNNGTSISAQRFAAELRSRGHEVKALCYDLPNESKQQQNIIDGVFQVPKSYTPIFQSLMDKHDFSFAKIQPAIIHQACNWADIVHIFTPFPMSICTVSYCLEIHKPLTAAFHIQAENLTSNINMGKVQWFNNIFYDAFRAGVYNRVRHVHAPSQFMADSIRQKGYTAKIHVISNGIQDEFMQAGKKKADYLDKHPRKADTLSDTIKIMMIGRLAQEKRQDVIINAVPYSKYADRIQLVFAGRGPLYDHYVELGKNLPHPPQFIYVGRDELIENLLSTDLYIHASDMESEAISCIEAFATGLVPVIANSEDSATPQFALDGRSLFLPGNPRDLARAIDYWLDHPHERLYMEELYRKSAKRYSLANSVTLFEQMLAEEIEDCKQQQA